LNDSKSLPDHQSFYAMGIEERKEREKLARREAIRGSAREFFFGKGFSATTMNEIAKKAELSKGALYLYFASKEELYVSVMSEGLSIFFERTEAINRVKSLSLTFDILQDHTHVTHTATPKRLSNPEGGNKFCFKYFIN